MATSRPINPSKRPGASLLTGVSTTAPRNTTITSPHKKRRINKPNRSVWNSSDDWDQLVADASLSTASISVRPPRPRGLQTLVKCAADAAARGFKRIREDDDTKDLWMDEWVYVPDHLKEKVREGVVRLWGSFLTPAMLIEIFAFPPILYLPGASLPTVSKATHLKPLRPPDRLEAFTTLILTHAAPATDIAIAGLVHHMPNLEMINLKGCSLAGDKVVQTILKQCHGLKRINLKGTGVKEIHVKLLLDRFGKQLECFKVDNIHFENINETFKSIPSPLITHLCLPGDFLNASSGDFRARARSRVLAVQPIARPTPFDSAIDWPSLSSTFPSLTHLSLPDLLVPSNTSIGLIPHTLVKLSLLQGSSPIPIIPLTNLILDQCHSLRTIHLGQILPKSTGAEEFHQLGEALASCSSLEDFRLDCAQIGEMQAIVTQAMNRFSTQLIHGMKGSWRKSLKHLALNIPRPIAVTCFTSDQVVDLAPNLETLHLPGANILDPSVSPDDPSSFASAISRYTRLRSLDLSGTTVTEDCIFAILDACALLSRIDLTSCRGVKVQHRRNIFKAWKESRE